MNKEYYSELMRRPVSALWAFLILCFTLPAMASRLGEDPDAFRDFIQNRYGVIIRMGDECGDWPVKTVELRMIPDGATPFQRLAEGNNRFAALLTDLDHAVSAYPPGFFDHFQPKLRFWLADEVFVDGFRTAGCFAGEDGNYEIALSRKDSDAGSPHHEIWHAMENVILEDDPEAFDHWGLLNPDGFVYTNDFSIMETDEALREPEDWFVIEYAKVDEKEDRAMTFKALMTRDADWWSTRPRLRKKAEYLLEKAEPVFGPDFAVK